MAASACQTRPDYLKEAFERFAGVIRPNDDRLFRDTTLQDVRTAAQVIERDQHQRRCQRNLRRIEPVLDALRKLGVALEPLSQGVPYLCYIWAPLKLLLQIADEYTKGFEQLLDAYAEIAKHLPRFDRLSSAFQDQPDFQAVLADIYSDILEFHTYAYRFLRRSGWKHLFDSTWKSFGTRFNAILQRLARGRDLIDKEAASFEILQGKAFRQTLLAEVEQQENARRDWQLRDTIAWLDLKGQDLEQEDLFERRVATREPDTCEWLLHHAKILTWLDRDDPRHFLWLRGKPGSGKTTLASYLIQQGSFPSKSTVIYCLCSYGFGKIEKNACNLALRSILAQIIRQKTDILDHVYDNYVKGASPPTLSKIRLALKECLYAIEHTFLVVDGLDECEPLHQNQLLSELMQMSEPADPLKLKVLVCSRESKEIKRKLGNKPVLSLREEKEYISKDIALFTKKHLQDLKYRFQEDVIDSIATEIVSRADGMFLWVHLIIGTLLDQESEHDLRRTLQSLPTKLPDVYKAILGRLDHEADQIKIRRINDILGCLAFAVRPLKVWEVCDLITLHEKDGVINEQTKLGVGILDICKPLVEEQDGHIITLVHFSARE